MIIPDGVRHDYFANLISGLAMNVVGPYSLKLVFQAFVVIVGVLILSGAVNTAIVGANGVLNRMSEDGVLTPGSGKPHPKFGTSYRIINLIVGLQILTIVASRGNVYLLASLYAFGVIWSFAFKSLAVVVLRYTEPENRRMEGPGKFPYRRGRDSAWAWCSSRWCSSPPRVVNLFTKELATISGVAFSLAFFAIFTVSERITAKQHAHSESGFDQFNIAAECRAQCRRPWKCARATFWSRCAIPTTCTTCEKCWPRPTPPRPTWWS